MYNYYGRDTVAEGSLTQAYFRSEEPSSIEEIDAMAYVTEVERCIKEGRERREQS